MCFFCFVKMHVIITYSLIIFDVIGLFEPTFSFFILVKSAVLHFSKFIHVCQGVAGEGGMWFSRPGRQSNILK